MHFHVEIKSRRSVTLDWFCTPCFLTQAKMFLIFNPFKQVEDEGPQESDVELIWAHWSIYPV